MDGKKIGLVAFIITEVVVVLGIVGAMVGLIRGMDLGISVTGIMTLQGSVFATTWMSVATKNFKKEK